MPLMGRAPLPLAQAALSALNHILLQQSAARARLRTHAGRCLRIVVDGPFGAVHSDATISADGLLALTSEGSPAAVLRLLPGIDAAFAALRAGPDGLGPHLRVEGDVMLAAAVGEVARSLRWDFEEDLSHLVGDTVAHRLGRVVRAGLGQVQTLRERFAEALQRSAAAEDGPLVSASQLAEFSDAALQLSVRIDGLERRQARLPRPGIRGAP